MSGMRVIVVGTRGSLLAQAQTRFVVERLRESWPETEFKIRTIQTPAEAWEEAGARELRKALSARTVDIALYPLKYLPTEEAPGLKLVAVPKRADPREAFVGKSAKKIEDLPEGAVVGTNMLGRKAQLLSWRKDLVVRDLHGDIEDRLSALAGDFDGIVMSAAGLIWLDLRNRLDQFIDPSLLLPPAGQGALGLEVRQGDDWAEELAYSLNHRPSFERTSAERAFVDALGAGMSAPAAALASMDDEGTLHLQGLLVSPNGRELIRGEIEGDPSEALELGGELARDLLDHGGRAILKQAKVH